MSQSSRTAAITSKQSRIYSDDETRFSDSSAAISSTMRPRNKRLISTEQELVSTTSRRSSPGGSSRGVSPIPSRHPSRRGGDNGDQSAGSILGGSAVGRGDQKTGPGNAGTWGSGWSNSWSTLQGLASSVLGDLEDLVTDEGEGSSRQTASLDRPKARRKDNSVKKLFELPHGAWGPAEQKKRDEAVIGAGSQSERDAAVRTQKMTRLLENHSDLNGSIDTNGNYKRRTSMDEITTGTQKEESDALVYIHHVKKEDTLAGVILRYNCQPMVFRKANRFWPHDSIQTRQVVVLPVDACAIKGRPCDPSQDLSQGIDLLAPTPSLEDAPEVWPPRSETPMERPDENPWEHVRWVLLDSSPNSKPVEIARIPRRSLGYFPPRRRKSQNTNSITSTPRGSYDLPRTSQTISVSSGEPAGSPSSTASRMTSNLGSRLSQSTSGSYFPPSVAANRPRHESVSEAADRLGWLRGPGGVGTLGKSVTTPGPGQDPLNTWARKHIPGITIDTLPSSSILESEAVPFGFRDELTSIAEGSYSPARSGSVTPSNLGGSGIGLENAAAAIEGWVRRLAVKTPGAPLHGGGTSTDGSGDLIELLDGAGSDDGKGFELSPGKLRNSSLRRTGTGSSGREDLEGAVRGRLKGGGGVKRGKKE
ncbi:hypothetical protein SBOR_3892 [Sclerotinia borealis F-4128]|uniref:LysM domain-containing protein n=1 Tax=Sclerotinia borealis (strain F-4128) TaxID=1432307 RepID=W9CM15_SCLBF|nr:hypothetical protein SBOR_3892 [Sclerotinia borealis F-4128]